MARGGVACFDDTIPSSHEMFPSLSKNESVRYQDECEFQEEGKREAKEEMT